MRDISDKPGYRTLLADSNREYLRLISDYLKETGQFKIVDYAFNGSQAFDLICSLKPELVVLDLLMSELDGFAVLEELAASGYDGDTRIVMTSAVNLDFVLQKAQNYNVDYMFIKPFEKEVFKRRLVELMTQDKNKPEAVSGRSEQFANEIVTRHIKQVGITANIKGYYYLRDAILMVHRDFELMSRLTTGLYASVANKYNSTPQRVERAMRHAIETAWNRGNICVLEEFFGYTILDSKGKPTNGEFIAMLADKLNTQLKYVD